MDCLNNSKNNKIGILTFHKSINYGSVLQAWALQTTLQSMGKNAYIVDYEPYSYKKIYGVFRSIKSIKNLKYNLARLPIAYIIKKQIVLFSNFRNNYMHLTKNPLYDVSQLDNSKRYYSALICGSDQVWNIHAHDCDKIFFLPFKFEGKKIAYAVSINNTNFKEKECDDNLKKCIQDFSAISCREKSGAEKIAEYIGRKDIFTALDPTLLLNKEHYEEICSDRIVRENYIFLYNVWTGDDAIAVAKKFSKIYNKPVYSILTKKSLKSIYRMEANGVKVQKIKTAPGDFLSLIRYSDFVISDSFHGTAFSLIFEKQFICVNQRINSESGCRLKNDERLLSILNALGLESRYVSIFDVNKLDMLETIDYKIITFKRMELAKQSLQWLSKTLEYSSASKLHSSLG